MAPNIHFTVDERIQIYSCRREVLPQAEIARRLKRDRATNSREPRRNSVGAGYVPTSPTSAIRLDDAVAAGDVPACPEAARRRTPRSGHPASRREGEPPPQYQPAGCV